MNKRLKLTQMLVKSGFVLACFAISLQVFSSPIHFELNAKADKNYRLQVFYLSDNGQKGFSEKFSTYVTGKASDDFVKLEWEIPSETLVNIRLDFGDNSDVNFALKSFTIFVGDMNIFWSAEDFYSDFYGNYDIFVDAVSKEELDFHTLKTGAAPDPFFVLNQNAKVLLKGQSIKELGLVKVSYILDIKSEKLDRIWLGPINKEDTINWPQMVYKIMRPKGLGKQYFNFYIQEDSRRFFLGLGTSEKNIFHFKALTYKGPEFERRYGPDKLSSLISYNPFVKSELIDDELRLKSMFYDGQYKPAIWSVIEIRSYFSEISTLIIKVLLFVVGAIVFYIINKKVINFRVEKRING